MQCSSYDKNLMKLITIYIADNRWVVFHALDMNRIFDILLNAWHLCITEKHRLVWLENVDFDILVNLVQLISGFGKCAFNNIWAEVSRHLTPDEPTRA